ncbi:hypothetical protein PsYK624_123380 [Phanerochaete sordida]|uniref:Uncharacterized protein n=1 Tax=Phanerochaete sordida TaxID=48140 RepID=A0A9P3LI98_9APHY|nr:hypothetical protein PsYK624_123380 [Phanerochaete sordida]
MGLFDKPDHLLPNIRDCVGHLDFVEANIPSQIPWSHHVVRLHRQRPQLTFSVDISWALEPETSLEPGRTTLLPFAALPKTLPGSTLRIGRLSVSSLRLASVKVLLGCVAQLGTMELSVEGVTFVDGAVPAVVRRRTRGHSRLQIVHVTRCFEDGNMASQYALASGLFASQGRMHLHEDMLELVEKSLVVMSPAQPPLSVDVRLSTFDSTEKFHSYIYSIRADDLPIAQLRVLLPARTPTRQNIEYLELLFEPHLASPSQLSTQWDALASAIIVLHPLAPTPLRLTCQRRAQATSLLTSLLASPALARLCAASKLAMHVRDDQRPLWLDVPGSAILSAPQSLTLNGVGVPLSAAQRAEWLMHATDDEKEAYARTLLPAERQAACPPGGEKLVGTGKGAGKGKGRTIALPRE